MTADTSIQLYTLRDEAAVDFRAVLMRLGAIGYVGVELAGFHGLTPAELRSTLDDAGLVLSSAHVGLAKPDEFEAALDEHEALGCDTVVVPMLPPKAFADLDAIRTAADRINAANERVRARGLTLGYHNHFWELPLVEGRPRASNSSISSTTPCSPRSTSTGRASAASTPPSWSRSSARAALLHVKDGPASDPADAMVAVGDGVIDVAGVVAASPAARWHIVELDRCDTDMFDAVERSYHYLVDNQLSRGRR